MGRTIPLVLAAFALALAGVLVVDQYVEHRQIEASTHVAASTMSTLGAVNAFEAALYQFQAAADAPTKSPVASSPVAIGVRAAHSRLDASMQAFERHLDGEDRTAWRQIRERIAAFGEPTLLVGRTGAPSLDELVAALQEDLAVLTSIVDERGLAALRTAQQQHTLEGALEAGVLFFLACASVALLVGWRRDEARARARDAQVEEQLHRALADLDGFAGRVAHDLRSPLAPILAGSQSIERATIPDAVRGHAERIERSARRLARLIEGLLQYTRASAAGHPEGAHAAVGDAVKDILPDFEEIASTRGARIDAELPSDCEVTSPPEVVQSIVSNLVDNALKYGVKEGVPSHVSIRSRVEGSFCAIEVEDAGPGVAPELRAQVFEPFFRGQTAGPGIGLGLSIVQRLVEAQRGRIELLEGAAGGALFRIWLPCAVEASHGASATRAPPASSASPAAPAG